MTATSFPVESSTDGSTLYIPALDLYRAIHKGIRAELFALTTVAGSLDPRDHCDRAAFLDQVRALERVLDEHAAHEDTAIDPVLAAHSPALSAQVNADHHDFEEEFRAIRGRAEALLVTDDAAAPALAHWAYLDLASFTSRYLAHQNLEERVVMPVIEAAVGFEGCLEIHTSIVGSLSPDELTRSLTFMLPAMNVDDRAELLGGMQANAPAEVFAGVMGLARSVLLPADYAAVAQRIGFAG